MGFARICIRSFCLCFSVENQILFLLDGALFQDAFYVKIQPHMQLFALESRRSKASRYGLSNQSWFCLQCCIGPARYDRNFSGMQFCLIRTPGIANDFVRERSTKRLVLFGA